MNNRELVKRIREASDIISRASRNGYGNYIVTNPCLEIPLGKSLRSVLGGDSRIEAIKRIKDKLNEQNKLA